MRYNPTTQPRSLVTGRYLPGPTAPESPITLGPTLAAQRQANAYRHIAEDGLDRDDRRRLARDAVKEILESGMLARMVGTSNTDAVGRIMDATRDQDALDAALDEVAAMERNDPGSIPPGALGKRIAARLYAGLRPAGRAA